MRQGAILFSLFLITVIVGCGGSGSLANSGTLTNPSLATGSLPTAGSSNPAPGTTTGGSATPPTGTAAGTPSSTPAASSATEVTISSPIDGATVSSPAQVSASASGSTAIGSIQL